MIESYKCGGNLSRNEATVLHCIFNRCNGIFTMVEIEHGCNLPEPVVSKVLRSFIAKDWIDTTPSYDKSRGRPRNHYWLTKTKPDIISGFITNVERQIGVLNTAQYQLEKEKLL